MIERQIFVRKDNNQIDAVYTNCKTLSIKYKKGAVYEEYNLINPPFPISRNHKVIFDAESKIIDTVLNVNPFQPKPKVKKPTKLEQLLINKGLITKEELESIKKKL